MNKSIDIFVRNTISSSKECYFNINIKKYILKRSLVIICEITKLKIKWSIQK